MNMALKERIIDLTKTSMIFVALECITIFIIDLSSFSSGGEFFLFVPSISVAFIFSATIAQLNAVTRAMRVEIVFTVFWVLLILSKVDLNRSINSEQVYYAERFFEFVFLTLPIPMFCIRLLGRRDVKADE